MAKRTPSLKQIERERALVDRKAEAARLLSDLFGAWVEEWMHSDWTIRAKDAVYREVRRIDREIWKGQIANVAERFNQAKDLALAGAIKKKRVTYLQTLTALEELLKLARAWQPEQPRSRAEQDTQLHLVRKLLMEIANGYLEELPTRFQNPPAEEPEKEEAPGKAQTEQTTSEES